MTSYQWTLASNCYQNNKRPRFLATCYTGKRVVKDSFSQSMVKPANFWVMAVDGRSPLEFGKIKIFAWILNMCSVQKVDEKCALWNNCMKYNLFFCTKINLPFLSFFFSCELFKVLSYKAKGSNTYCFLYLGIIVEACRILRYPSEIRFFKNKYVKFCFKRKKEMGVSVVAWQVDPIGTSIPRGASLHPGWFQLRSSSLLMA